MQPSTRLVRLARRLPSRIVPAVDFASASSAKCVPCEGIGRAMTPDEVRAESASVPAWGVSKDWKKISRHVEMSDFRSALAYINAIGDVAEVQGHHPDLAIREYNKVTVELWTHALDGLSSNDFIMAKEIDALKGDKQ